MRGLATLALMLAMARPAAAAPMSEAIVHLDERIAAFNGTAAVVVDDPALGFRYARNDDVEFVSASLYKLGVMVEAYRQAEIGAISLDDTVTVGWEDVSVEDGWYVDPGTDLTVREALEWAITWSDNATAVALLRLLDVHSVNAAFASLGMAHTRINWSLPEDERTGDVNITTARDMERLFSKLVAGTVVSAGASREMLALLARQHVNDRLPSGLPDGAVVAHKTGDLWDVAHDAGVIFTPAGPRIAVVLTAHHASYDDVVSLAGAVAGETWALAGRRFGASLTPLAMPVTADAGRPVAGSVRVTNRSTYAWTRGRMTTRWLDSKGGLALDTGVVPLPALPPEGSVTIALPDVAPPPGLYVLELRAGDGDAVGAPLLLPLAVR